MGVVLVHGAWHGAWCWDGVVAALERRGIPSLAVELPFTGFDDDVEEVERAIATMGPGALVVGHSYGGFVISSAAAGCSDVAGLVYIAAFMADEGEDALTILEAHDGHLTDALVIEQDEVTVDPAKAKELFYGDLDDTAAAPLIARLRPISFSSAAIVATDPAWRTITSTYVLCSNDRAIPEGAQRWMARRASVVHELPSDHSPFNTRPDEIAEIIHQAM